MAFLENASDRLARYGHDMHHQEVSGNVTVHNGDNNYVSASKVRQKRLARGFGTKCHA